VLGFAVVVTGGMLALWLAQYRLRLLQGISPSN